MSTVTQVESVIERWSAEEQQQLLQWLLARAVPAVSPQSREGRAAWLKRLADRRARLGTGTPGPTVEALLGEDRGE